MTKFVKAFADGEEPGLDLSAFSGSSLTDLAFQVVSTIRESLPEGTPQYTSIVFSLITFLGYSRGKTTGVAQAPVIVRAAQDPKTVAKVFIRTVASDSETDFSTSDLTGVRGWSTSRKLARDGSLGAVANPVGVIEVFLAPQALKSFVDTLKDESGPITFQGIQADQIPRATLRLLEHPAVRRSFSRQILQSVLLEVEGDEEAGWARPLLEWSLPSGWLTFVREDLRTLLHELRASGPAGETVDGAPPSWGFIDLAELEGGSGSPLAGSGTGAHTPPPLPAVFPFPHPPSTMDPTIISQIFKGMLEVVKSQTSSSSGDLEGQRMVRVLKEALSPELARLVGELDTRSNGPSARPDQRASAQAALHALHEPSRTTGDSTHSALGASVATPGECVAYVGTLVSERTCHVGLAGALLGTSALDGQLAANFISSIAEKGLHRLGFEVEGALRDQGEPATALSSSGSMGSRRVDILRGLLSFDGVAGYLPLFVPPRFRLGETDYADGIEAESARGVGSTAGWSTSRLEYKAAHRNLGAERPRASRFFIEVKSPHRCSALLLSLHGYLAALEAAGVPGFFLRLLRGGLTRALAHADEVVNNLLTTSDSGPTRTRAIHYLTHAFLVLDEAFSSFVGQFSRPAEVAAPFDNFLRERDDAEASPLFKRQVQASGSSSFALTTTTARSGKG